MTYAVERKETFTDTEEIPRKETEDSVEQNREERQSFGGNRKEK